jgi:hypothetical protein
MVEYMDQTVLLLGSLGTFPVYTRGMSWKDWASAVVLLPSVSKFQPPDPNKYDDWLSWASDFNKTVVVNVT